MKVNIYCIDKRGKKEIYEPIIEHYKKITKPFSNVEIIDIFNNQIAKAQDSSESLAKKSYTDSFVKYLKGGYNIALDPNAKEVDSFEFSKLLTKNANINFFIAGAYGFEKEMLNMCDIKVSFGRITMSHKLIKVVLLEQIYRGFSILNNHPYHK